MEYENALRRMEFPLAKPSPQRFRRARKIQENEIKEIFFWRNMFLLDADSGEIMRDGILLSIIYYLNN